MLPAPSTRAWPPLVLLAAGLCACAQALDTAGEPTGPRGLKGGPFGADATGGGDGSSDAGGACETARDLGDLHDTPPGGKVVVEGTCPDDAPEEWYRFNAVDDPDTSCDNFHVDLRFLANPGNAFVFSVYPGSCAGTTETCESDTAFVVATDTRQGTGETAWGECPCKAEPKMGSNQCTDNTMAYYVVVRRAPGSPDPAGARYRLEISNGNYSYSY